MARKGDPGVLRFVVLWLRAFARWSQTQLGDACGVYQADVSRWEQGVEAPSEERLRRMAAGAGVPWFVVALLRRVFALALAIAELFGGAGAAEPAGSLDRAVFEPAGLAVTTYFIEEEEAESEPLSPEQARREAAEALAELMRLPPPRRYRLIEAAHLDRRRREALAEEARRAGEEAAAHDAATAGELAELGRFIEKASPVQ
jgi:transcriptional regulator with XRE-family HTH domain